MTVDGKADQRETPTHNSVHQQPQEVLELVAAGPDQKNWRGIGIALLVIIVVCGLIVAAILLLTPGDKGLNSKKSKISLDEVLKGKFSYRRFNGSWVSDFEFIYRDPFNSIGLYDIKNKSEQLILGNTTLRQYSISNIYLSSDRQYLLLENELDKIFRYTYKSKFLLYNITSDHINPLLPKTPDIYLQHASWGPSGNQLVYVLDNNIYYLSDVSANPRQLTTNGANGLIYNGIPDWVYEEEVLATSHALWWSPDGNKLCFASFNDSEVDIMAYPYYGSYTKFENVYPKLVSLRYPKAGKKNPTVSLWIADLTQTKDPIAVEPPEEYKNLEYYFNEAQWVDSKTVSVVWLKRSQNTSVISLCKEEEGWACKKNTQVDSIDHTWLDLSKTIFSSDGKWYFLRLSSALGNSGSYKHVAAVDVISKNKTFLTDGKYDTVSLLGHSSEKKTLYYISTLEGKPGERHVFGVTDTTHHSPKEIKCYSCDVSPNCLYNDATFSPNFSYFIFECLGPGIPQIEIRSTDTNEIVSLLDKNEELKEFVDTKAMPRIRNFKVPLDGGYNASVRLYLPPSLQEYEITKYPMLVEVYGGPGSQMVNEKFSVNWGYFLSSKKNIIYAKIDGRGSGYQGDKMLHELYHNLGSVEVEDQVYVTSYLKEHVPYIDKKHVAIFGWSYGGFVSALSLTNEENVFSCGISVAPVTNWIYYDSVYTERYMGMPTKEDNRNKYEKSSVTSRAKQFRGKKYLLVHGTADDNVHWQQSMMLAKALTDAGVLFRMQVYPDENHGLGHVKLHLYQTLDDFLDHCYSDSYKDELSYQSTQSESER